ncbi:sugar-binding protein [Myxococcota bacterium]
MKFATRFFCCAAIVGWTVPTAVSADPLYVVSRVDSPPTMEGGEWDTIATITVTLDATGAQGSYRLAWDETALYVAGWVSDTRLYATVEDRDGGLWIDDSCEFLFDTGIEGGATQLPDDNDYKFVVNLLGAQEDSRGAGAWGWNGIWDSRVVPDGSNRNNSNVDGGYTLEIAIPWNSWGVEIPTAGTAWGFDVVLNDRVDSAEKYDSAWANPYSDYNVPDYWGELLFSSSDCPDCVYSNVLLGNGPSSPVDVVVGIGRPFSIFQLELTTEELGGRLVDLTVTVENQDGNTIDLPGTKALLLIDADQDGEPDSGEAPLATAELEPGHPTLVRFVGLDLLLPATSSTAVLVAFSRESGVATARTSLPWPGLHSFLLVLALAVAIGLPSWRCPKRRRFVLAAGFGALVVIGVATACNYATPELLLRRLWLSVASNEHAHVESLETNEHLLVQGAPVRSTPFSIFEVRD